MNESIPYQVIQTEDTVVHVTYGPQQILSKPAGSPWTRFARVSNGYCAIFPLPPEDALIHAGDMTRTVRSTTVSTLNLIDENVN